MAEPPPIPRFYADLAPWWPLISPVEAYVDEAREFAALLASHGVRTMLELGSGGGHVAWHLKPHFALTLSDLSPGMLACSAQLNPECRHVPGDMRSVRLRETFDAVFIHDAIDYMTTAADLRDVLATAFVHCRPGGVALIVPDHITETFEASTDCGGSDGGDGRGVRYLEWSYDPDPTDTCITTEYAFLLRHADGHIETVAERHDGGLFPLAAWEDVLDAAGFRPEVLVEQTDDDRMPRRMFLGHRPG